jgi:FecR protein
MFYRSVCAFWLLTLPVQAQSVISTHSGIVYFFEGSVYLGDQVLQPHPGKFSSVPPGAELRTAEGRAEVLLTPGVFVRIGARSAIRMVANELSDTRVELLAGSALVDSAEPNSGTSVTLIYKNWSVRFLEQGVYRIDTDPPRLSILQGKAEVSAGTDKDVTVERGMNLPFASVLVPQPLTDWPRDALSAWAEGRQQSISADDAIAANIQDPASLNASDSGLNSFTYFPMLGLPSPGTLLSGTYSSVDLSQPGFNSIYLPGYTFLPFLVGLRAGGLPPTRFPWHPRPTRPTPVFPVYPHPVPVRPVSPHPIRVHPAPRVGMHGGFHR